MNARFLADSMSVYIEKEIAANINLDTIIDEFKAHNAQCIILEYFKLCSLIL
jgi:hypothetical protein